MRDVGGSSSGNVSCAADTSHTNAHRTDAPALSFEAIGDDRDFAQYARPRRDHRLPARFRTGDFVSIDTPRTPARARLLAPDFRAHSPDIAPQR